MPLLLVRTSCPRRQARDGFELGLQREEGAWEREEVRWWLSERSRTQLLYLCLVVRIASRIVSCEWVDISAFLILIVAAWRCLTLLIRR